MESTSKITPISDREISYYRQRHKNRIFSALISFFEEEAERTGITRRVIAERLKRDPAQITRWLSTPTNLTVESISDLLLAAGAEMDSRVVRFSEREEPNYAHPLIERIITLQAQRRPTAVPTGKIKIREQTASRGTTASTSTNILSLETRIANG